MSICVQYDGSVPSQYLDEFITQCKVDGSAPEQVWTTSGEFMTDGWNQRGWDNLLNCVKLIAEKYDCITTLDCYYSDGPTNYCTSYTCDGEVVIETENMEELEEEDIYG